MPKINIHDGMIYYEEHGNKKNPPLILISGLGQSHQYWLEVTDILSQQYYVILFDHRGTGQSDLILPCSIDEMASDINALMDNLSIDSAHITGHSMGGFIAQTFCAHYPSRVRKLLLYSTGYRPEARIMFHIQTQYDLMRTAQMPSELMIRIGMPWVYSNEFFTQSDNLIAQKIQDSIEAKSEQNPENIQHHINACKAFDSSSFLKNIKAGTLILYGQQDLLLDTKQNEYMAANIKRAKLMPIKHAAHSFHLEHPKQFSNILIDFFS